MKRAWAAILWLTITAVGSAQTLTGRIEGRIVDGSGGSVAGAAVSALHEGTQAAYNSVTNDAGWFRVPSVRLGSYRVTVEAPGFKRAVVEGVQAEVGTAAELDIVLEIGEPTFEVTVETSRAQSLVNLTDAEVGSVIDNRRVLDLPLNGRNAVELAVQQAGVYFEKGAFGQGDKFFVNGQRHRGTSFTLDGIDTQDNMNRSSTTMIDQPLLPMAAENVEEFKVVTANASAEYGRGGSHINAVTRAGTNEFHGSLFEFHRNTVLNANDFFNNSSGVDRAPLVRNQFGGRIGGPIAKNRTFFYFGYQQTRESRSLSVNRTVYSQEARNGLFRFLDGVQTTPANVAANPGLVRSVNLLECSGGLVPALGRDCVDGRFSVANPATADPFLRDTVFAAIPTPNNFEVGDGLNTGGFRWNAPVRTAEHLPTLRLDHRLNDKHWLYASLNYVDRDIAGDFINGREPVFPGVRPLGSRVTHSRGLNGTWTATLTPTFLNELRFGFLGGENAFLVTQPFDTPHMIDLNTVTDIYDPYNADQVRDNERLSLRESASWIRGRHSFKFGGEWRRWTVDEYNFDSVATAYALDDNNFSPVFSSGDLGAVAGGSLTSSELETAADLSNNLVGAVADVFRRYNAASLGSGFVGGAPERHVYRNWEFDWFVNDSWSVRPNLTLNLGLRWEFASVPSDLLGVVLAPQNGIDSVFGPSGRAGFLHPGVLQGEPCGLLSGAPTTANAVALLEGCSTRYVPATKTNGAPLWKPDKNNFAPVVSLAWDPFGTGKTSIRAGFRVSYIQDAFSIVDQNLDDNEGLVVDQACSAVNGTCLNNAASGYLRDVVPAGTTPAAPEFSLPAHRSILDSSTIDFRAFDPNLATSYYNEWTFGISRQVAEDLAIEVRYLGNRGVKLRRVADFSEMNLDAKDSVTGQTFLESYLTAQANLACNRSSGFGARFDDSTGAACLQQNPLMAALIDRDSGRLRGRSSLVNALDFNEPGEFIYRLTQSEFSRPANGQNRLRGGAFWGNVLDGRLPVNFFQANPFVTDARAMLGDGVSTYHSLQIDVRRRMARGLSLNGSYTFGKALSNYDGDDNSLLNSGSPSPIRNRRYTMQQFMPRHTIKLNGFYELPIGKGPAWRPASRLVRAVLGDWQIGGLTEFRTGRPLSVFSGRGTFLRGGSSFDNTVDLAQPMTNGELQQTVGRRDLSGGVYWIDPCTSAILGGGCQGGGSVAGLFQLPQSGRLGTLPQTPVFGPQRFILDFNLVKRISLTERTGLEFRWEVFNAFNNVNFGQPEDWIFSPTFGRINQTVTDPRLMQFGLKLNF